VPSQSHFGLELARSLAHCQQISAKIDAVCGHGTISVDAEPFHFIHMGLANDVVMQNSLLVANLCQANPILGLSLPEAWHTVNKFQPKLMLFAGTAPYQLMLNHFIPSIWVLQMML
jgi:hypothetical protein